MHMLTEIEIPAGLSQFEKDWARTAGSASELYAGIPDGIYEAVIEDAWLTETPAEGGAALVWRLRIPGPGPGGRAVTKMRLIARETLGRLHRDLEKCGLDLDRLTELPSRIGEITGNRVGLSKRTRNGRVCFYLRWPSLQCSPVSVRFLRAMMLNSCPAHRTPKSTLRLLRRSATLSSECRTA